MSPPTQIEVTKVGYIPIVQGPAHEFDTLNAVVKRCMHVSSVLGQRYTVTTVDQALYCKLVEFKWTVPEYQEKLVVLLGGLQISMCFLKTVGNHMNGSFLECKWWRYPEMLSILLNFTRAQREGNWELLLKSFCPMLPYFFRYDHLSCAKWGSVFIAEMRQFPIEVLREFRKRDFVVKWSEGRFNQVSADHGLKWLNGIGKRGGGIIGITKISSALSR